MFRLQHLQTTNNQNLRELDDFDDSLELSEEDHRRIQEYVDLLDRSRTLLEILCEALGVEGTGTYLHRNSVQPWDLLNNPNNFVTTTLFTHTPRGSTIHFPPTSNSLHYTTKPNSTNSTKPRRVKIPLGIRLRATRRRNLQTAIANTDRTLCTRKKTYHQGRYLLRTHGL